MNSEVLDVYNNLDTYVLEAEKDIDNCDVLWNKYAIEPYWPKLSQWAPFDLSERKPKPIKNISQLKKQLEILKQIDIDALKRSFDQVANSLPDSDEDITYIALYPLSDDDTFIKEYQNGVLGTNTFGNIILHINPLAEDYLQWMHYVFAHEYHHNVWGRYWFVLHNTDMKGYFIESMLNDGQADAFALSLNPGLRPKWIFDLTPEQETELWERHYSKIIYSRDADYEKYMFGDPTSGIPWCAGYAFAYKIVNSFIKKHPDITFSELVEIAPADIMAKSGYPDSTH